MEDYQQQQLLRRPKKLSLYKALKVGYLRNEKKQAKRLKRFGYIVDKELTGSGIQRVVAYNPVTKQVLYVVNGSATDIKKYPKQFVRDWLGTNISGYGTGGIKRQGRYIRESKAYDELHQKYKGAKVVLVGHSLGGGIVSRLAKGGDEAYTADAANINQKPRPNVLNIRTQGDPVSALARDTITLPNPEADFEHGYFQPHDVSNIKNVPIYV